MRVVTRLVVALSALALIAEVGPAFAKKGPSVHQYSLDIWLPADTFFTHDKIQAVVNSVSRIHQIDGTELHIGFKTLTFHSFQSELAFVTDEAKSNSLLKTASVPNKPDTYTVYVVQSVPYCDGDGTIWGCANRSHRAMMVTLFPDVIDPVPIWFHELGHLRNLNHQNDNSLGLMYCRPTDMVVTLSQAQAFDRDPAPPGVQVETTCPVVPPTPDQDLSFLLSANISEGQLYKLTRKLPPSAVSKVRSFLSDPEEVKHRVNALWTLGGIATDESLLALHDHILFGSGPISSQEAQDRLAAIISYGKAINKNPKPYDVAILCAMCFPSYWTKNVTWTSDFFLTRQLQENELALYSMKALAISASNKNPIAFKLLSGLSTTSRWEAFLDNAISQRGLGKLGPLLKSVEEKNQTWAFILHNRNSIQDFAKVAKLIQTIGLDQYYVKSPQG